MNLQRRQWLTLATRYAAALFPVGHAAQALAAGDAPGVALAATWQSAGGYQVGLLAARGAALQVLAGVDVPTRAHGVLREASGSLLAVARRPGDWLLRWHPGAQGEASQRAQWGWIEADRAFNGHVVSSRDGRTLYTTETNLETGSGMIGVRDAASLEKIAEWPTHGMDPHELLLDVDGSLVVANGGIPALPETGRVKLNMEQMDASLVRLHPVTGALLGQWRLADARLSLRHIAWGPLRAPGVAQGHAADAASFSPGARRLLGVALQAEHADPATQKAAPVLALFDGQTLQVCTADAGQALLGYGGDIACNAEGFSVSCPRAQGVAQWGPEGQWRGWLPLTEACALASVGDTLWVGGREGVLNQAPHHLHASTLPPQLRLDNHWADWATRV